MFPHQARCRSSRGGFSLVEMLIVLAVMSIALSVALPSLEPDTADQLTLAAQRLVADLDYVRTLAIANNTSYEVQFAPAENQYQIEHSGSAAVWDVLPASVHFTAEAARAGRTRWVVPLAQSLPAGCTVSLHSLRRDASGTRLDRCEFRPLGHLEPGERLVVWLAAGPSAQRRYLPVYIELTGFAWPGEVSTSGPGTGQADAQVDKS